MTSKGICNKNSYTATVAAMVGMSLHHVHKGPQLSLSSQDALFPSRPGANRSVPMLSVQTRVVLLLRVTHTDTELPHTLTGTLLMSQTSRDIAPPLGQAVGSALSYIP